MLWLKSCKVRSTGWPLAHKPPNRALWPKNCSQARTVGFIWARKQGRPTEGRDDLRADSKIAVPKCLKAINWPYYFLVRVIARTQNAAHLTLRLSWGWALATECTRRASSRVGHLHCEQAIRLPLVQQPCLKKDNLYLTQCSRPYTSICQRTICLALHSQGQLCLVVTFLCEHTQNIKVPMEANWSIHHRPSKAVEGPVDALHISRSPKLRFSRVGKNRSKVQNPQNIGGQAGSSGLGPAPLG